jgi:hypothetical protein
MKLWRSQRWGASGGVDAPLQHPCPLCLDNEDDGGALWMCYSCGQLFCGSCKTISGEHGVTNCPTCRTALDISVAEQTRQLHRLLARPDGRHTKIAQFNLGVRYGKGAGAVQDEVEAVRWYRLSADRGYASAQFNLALCYHSGIGVPRDSAEAARWFRLAADQGQVTAQVNLGLMYRDGVGPCTGVPVVPSRCRPRGCDGAVHPRAVLSQWHWSLLELCRRGTVVPSRRRSRGRECAI